MKQLQATLSSLAVGICSAAAFLNYHEGNIGWAAAMIGFAAYNLMFGIFLATKKED